MAWKTLKYETVKNSLEENFGEKALLGIGLDAELELQSSDEELLGEEEAPKK